MKKFIINTDGASRGNPGQAASAYIIKSADGLIWHQEGIRLGVTTNNQAEYQAVQMALEKLQKDFAKFLPTEVEIKADSLLVVNQLSGSYKIKNNILLAFFNQIKLLEKEIGQVKYTYVPRSANFLADKLANNVLDNHDGVKDLS